MVRYANDAIHEHKCNAIIIEHNGKVYLQATKPIQPNEEIYVQYGPGYWADRFKQLSTNNSVSHTPFQKQLIRAYLIQPLPDGTAVTRKDALARHTISPQPSTDRC